MEDLKFSEESESLKFFVFFRHGDVDLTRVDTCDNLSKRMLCVCARARAGSRKNEKKKKGRGQSELPVFSLSTPSGPAAERESEGARE